MKKIFTALLLLTLQVFTWNTMVFAATPAEDDKNQAPLSILPTIGAETCDDIQTFRQTVDNYAADESQYLALEKNEQVKILTCGIRTGYMKFWMLKYYVVYVLNFLIGISGVLAVLMLIVGAYYYILGGFNEDVDTGKNIIRYALLGFVLVLLSWSLVNGLLILITS